MVRFSPRAPRDSEIFRGTDHRPPHVRDGAVVEAQTLFRLAERAADDIGELLRFDRRVRTERIDAVQRDHPVTVAAEGCPGQ